MCMATLIPAYVEIPWDGLANGAETNNDGHGFAIASSEYGIEVFKSMKYEETAAALVDARAKHGPGSPVLFHSRWATHGEYGQFNIHPFHVTDDTVMAHNGVLPVKYHPKDGPEIAKGFWTKPADGKPGFWTKAERGPGDRRSDTRIFVDEVTADYCTNAKGVPSRSRGKELAELIGTGNKLVFLSIKSGRPRTRIINSQLGDWVGGVWFSNGGYKCVKSWSGSSYSVGSGLWGHDSFWDNYKDCPHCKGKLAVDIVTNVCVDCDWCLDCEEEFMNCGCHYTSQYHDAEKLRDGEAAISEISDDLSTGWISLEEAEKALDDLYDANLISDDEYIKRWELMYTSRRQAVGVSPDMVETVKGQVVVDKVDGWYKTADGTWHPTDLVTN